MTGQDRPLDIPRSPDRASIPPPRSVSALRTLTAACLVVTVAACGFLDRNASPEDPEPAAEAADAGRTTPIVGDPGLTALADSLIEAVGQDVALTRLLLQVAASQMALQGEVDSLSRRLDAEQERDGGASDIFDAAGGLFMGLAKSAAVIALMLVFTYLAGRVLDALAERYPRQRLWWKRALPVVRIAALVVAAWLIVGVVFQVDAQGLVTAGAAVGVVVGFAAQDLLKNLFGGVILVFDQPFQVGDKISVAGTYGEVVSIGIRSTRLVTPDDNLVSVPNAQVVDGQVANANAGQLNCQVVTDLYLPGVVDEARAKKIAFEAAASSKYVYLNKPIVVLVKDEFKETFLTRVRVKAYVLDPRYEFLFQSDVTERARAGFREAGLMTPSMGMRAWLDLSQTAPPDPSPPPSGTGDRGDA